MQREQELTTHREEVLKLARQARELVARAQKGTYSMVEADALHEQLRQRAGEERHRLSEALWRFASNDSDVPRPGDDPLAELPAEVDRNAIAKLREEAGNGARKLRRREAQFEDDRARDLYQGMVALNESRLSLVPYISVGLRDALASLTPRGLSQATSEIQQVWLVFRYHSSATLHWVASLKTEDAERGQFALSAIWFLLKALIPLLIFLWWRRRAKATLQAFRPERAGDSQAPLGQTRHRIGPMALELLIRVHGPLEWLALLLTVIWLLPTESRALLEVQLAKTVFLWVLGGILAVYSFDFFAAQDARSRKRKGQLDTAAVRMRSLRLVGALAVVFGLILSLTSQLVGKGTIYGWVTNLCWLAGVFVALLLVKWWRHVILQRVQAKRKPSRLEGWIAKHPTGWQSVVGAVLGGGLLLVGGTVRVVANWAGTFEVTRRVLAYLFRREIAKQASKKQAEVTGPLAHDVYQALGPERVSAALVPSVADAQVDDVIQRIRAPGGGVFAIVGARGLGKSTMLSRIEQAADDVYSMECPFGGMEHFAPTLLKALKAAPGALIEDVAARCDANGGHTAGVLIDDAHRLILPMMGGLRAFDRVLDIARSHSKNIAWVFAFDDVIWRFFERMRGARPLFDDVIRLKPWGDAAIARLLEERSAEVQLDPSFEPLLGELPPDADDGDKEEALERTRANYYRLIWDYAGGNPGVALHAWRKALGAVTQGNHCVRLFEAPTPEALETLPDPAVFVLRAVVQLEQAEAESISRATGISLSEVEDALRFGMVHGYFERAESAYRVNWDWFRAITLFLQRRHLLFPA